MKYGRKEHGHYEGKTPKQNLTSAKDQTLKLPRDATHPTINQTKFTNITNSLIYGP